MKILHFFHTLELGGAQAIRFTIIKELLLKDPSLQHKVVSFANGELRQNFLDLGVAVHVLAQESPFPRLFQIPKIIRIISEFEPDIIHSLPWIPNFIGRIFLKPLFPKIRFICDFHGKAYLGSLQIFLDKITYSFADCWLFVTSELKTYFSSLWSVPVGLTKNFKVLPNFVDLERFSFDPLARKQIRLNNGFSDQTFVLGIAARLEAVKRLPMLLTYVSALSKQLPAVNVALIIAGDGPEKNNLNALISALGLQSCVTLTKLSLNQMPQFYNMLDAFVLCSESEGLPLVLLEAAATGTPILLSSNLRNFKMLFTTNAPVYSFSSTNEFCGQIKQLRETVSARLNFVKHLYFKLNVIEQYVQLYKNDMVQ